jgi:hypothetical protein
MTSSVLYQVQLIGRRGFLSISQLSIFHCDVYIRVIARKVEDENLLLKLEQSGRPDYFVKNAPKM